jgi:hypothetical protein
MTHQEFKHEEAYTSCVSFINNLILGTYEAVAVANDLVPNGAECILYNLGRVAVLALKLARPPHAYQGDEISFLAFICT